ncbi:MAG: class I SAM-dependent methyltransferase, partial [Chloroflexi bacterium]|nr:class I SAM-dependent methyltransferase [Chloroflexota bacterium]
MTTTTAPVLDATMPQRGVLLELGCGTGVEAAALAERSPDRRLLATDLSWAMLAEAQRRAEAAGLAGRLTFRQMPAAAAGSLAARYEEGAFAGAYSSFGALNCEPDLRPVATGLATLLPQGAPLVVSVMGRWPLWEMLWHRAHGDLGGATRRLRKPAPSTNAGVPGTALSALPVRYYT